MSQFVDPDTARELALATPPAATAMLNVFGIPVADPVQAVMLIWGLSLLAQKAWQFACWIARKGWRDLWQPRP